MTDSIKQRAETVVGAFRELVGGETAQVITDGQYDQLRLMVRAAISAELEAAARSVDEAAAAIRERMDKTQRAI